MIKNRLSNKILYVSKDVWKNSFLAKRLLIFKPTNRFVYNRANTVIRTYLNLRMYIYNGKTWQVRFIHKWRLGFKVGEFTWNKKPAFYKVKKKKK